MGAMQEATHDDPLGSLHWPPIVPKAITLRGAELSEAILRGYKDIENRTIRLGPGWWRCIQERSPSKQGAAK